MDDEQAEALGRRLVACDGFRWMPGMRAGGAALGRRLHCMYSEEPISIDNNLAAYMGPTEGSMSLSDSWPDLRDPATRGCVLALVRERWPDASAQRLLGHAVAPVWEVRVPKDPSFPGAYVCRSICEADTEAEALVAALEATG